MTVGMILAALAFIAAALVQLQIDKTLPKFPAGDASQVKFINMMNATTAITAGAESVTMEPFVSSGPYLTFDKPFDLTVSSMGNDTTISHVELDAGKRQTSIIFKEGSTVTTRMFLDLSAKPEQGANAIRFVNGFGSDLNVTVGRLDFGSIEIFNISEYKLLPKGNAQFKIISNMNEECIYTQDLGFGSSFTLVIPTTFTFGPNFMMRALGVYILLTLISEATFQADYITEADAAGIVLKDQSGLLITNVRTVTRTVAVKFDSSAIYRKHMHHLQQAFLAEDISSDLAYYLNDIIKHGGTEVSHIIAQIQKNMVTLEELKTHPVRQKRFLGLLLSAAAAVGSIFSLGNSGMNTVTLHHYRTLLEQLQAEQTHIKAQYQVQSDKMQTIGETLKKTIVVVNTYSQMFNRSFEQFRMLKTMMDYQLTTIQVAQMLMNDMLREVEACIEALSQGRIPAYLVPMSLVQDILSQATGGPVSLDQAHLAYALGGALLLTADAQHNELAFILSLPIIDNQNVYRLKDVVNVGGWHDDTYVRITTPEVVAYHDSTPSLYLAPNLKMCTLVKDVHYLCPSKPFTRDNTNGICGLKPMQDKSRCMAQTKSRAQVLTTKAEIVGNRWLVSSPQLMGTIRYDIHDTSNAVALPSQTFWVNVPKGAIFHVGEMALFHLPEGTIPTELEISSFFDEHELKLDSNTLRQLEGAPQQIELTALDAALETKPVLMDSDPYTLAGSWSASDSLLVLLVVLGYIIAAVTAFLFGRRLTAVNRRSCNVAARFKCREASPSVVMEIPEVTPLHPPFQGDRGTLPIQDE